MGTQSQPGALPSGRLAHTVAGTTSWSFLGPAVPHMARLVLVLSLSGHSGSGVLFSAVLREADGAAGVLARALLLGALRLCSLATPLGGQPRQRRVNEPLGSVDIWGAGSARLGVASCVDPGQGSPPGPGRRAMKGSSKVRGSGQSGGGRAACRRSQGDLPRLAPPACRRQLQQASPGLSAFPAQPGMWQMRAGGWYPQGWLVTCPWSCRSGVERGLPQTGICPPLLLKGGISPHQGRVGGTSCVVVITLSPGRQWL
ncbi:Hypothetical predicted protein [Marmota monax]|uniref:Uncharacterized protein n=1 Tax=Marmota monax TaxID=9995 RepID=A0A5E4AIV6_MARMO|nr:hypothetical protein GHT09_004366 [Marmota monax]VTJ57218.1 Hypothetical predicted protein [Marmota monax]